ncbi:hypothetical protein MNBD_BACTEROID01-1875 [hydrothermal vent metagenome]|uniref:Glycoside hydrolase family 31 TIM barrel domain-containing protein n=1 Tax=hydrothermal vent metagenome TaxID=652676 RepID=A0A3B0U492_9ZZZZ
MIDDNWQEDYGKWDFHPGRFPNPKGMMDSLHQMGFKVMVWICPFVSPDCDVAPMLEKGEKSRKVLIPEGKWENAEGEIIKGPKTIEITVAIDELPVFERVE